MFLRMEHARDWRQGGQAAAASHHKTPAALSHQAHIGLGNPLLVTASMQDRQRAHPQDAKEGDARQLPAPQIVHLAESYRTPPLRHIQASDGRRVPAGYCDVNLYLLSDSTHLLRITTTPGQHLIALPKPQTSLRPNFYNICTAPILDPNGVTVDAIFVTVGM